MLSANIDSPGQWYHSVAAAKGGRRPPLPPGLTPGQLFPRAAVWQPLFTSSTDWEASALVWGCTHTSLFYLQLRVSGSPTGSPVHVPLQAGTWISTKQAPAISNILGHQYGTKSRAVIVCRTCLEFQRFRMDVAAGRKGGKKVASEEETLQPCAGN